MDGNSRRLNDAVHGCLHATDFTLKEGGAFRSSTTLLDA